MTFFRGTSTGNLTDDGYLVADGAYIIADNNSWPTVYDWDEDGRKDLLVGQEGIGQPCNVYVYLNEGTNAAPVFGDSTPVLFNGSPLTYYRTVPVIEDLDGDGLKDMILGGWYSDVRFYTNVGTNSNPIYNSYIYLVLPDSSTYLNGNPPRLNFTDWDGDSDLDMITCDYYGSVFLRENITPPGIIENNAQMITLGAFTITPNPVKQRAAFKYQLTKDALVRADVYSIDGTLITSPFKKYNGAGEVHFTWDIGTIDRNKLPNGVYFVRLTSGTEVQTQKLLIIR